MIAALATVLKSMRSDFNSGTCNSGDRFPSTSIHLKADPLPSMKSFCSPFPVSEPRMAQIRRPVRRVDRTPRTAFQQKSVSLLAPCAFDCIRLTSFVHRFPLARSQDAPELPKPEMHITDMSKAEAANPELRGFWVHAPKLRSTLSSRRLQVRFKVHETC